MVAGAKAVVEPGPQTLSNNQEIEMARKAQKQKVSGFFSEKLASEFQSVLQNEYGKNVTLSEAQQIGLRIAQFVFMKEARRRATD